MLVFPSIMPLAREFYNRKTVRVAKDLIGKYLVRRNMPVLGRKSCGGLGSSIDTRYLQLGIFCGIIFR